jgi:hypothetical protein
MNAMAHDCAEVARWGRLLGRLDARDRALGANGESGGAHAGAFRRSDVWLDMDDAGRRVFEFAHQQGRAEWLRMARLAAAAAA